MKKNLIFGVAIFCMLMVTTNAISQEIVKDVAFSTEQAKVQMAKETPSSYFIEIGGPDNYYHKERVDYTSQIDLSNINAKGEKFADGLYTLQVTPIFELTPEQRQALSKLREVNDQTAIAAFRHEHNLPDEVDQFAMHFSILNGEFVISDQVEGKLNLPTMSSQWELNHPSLYASINTVGLDYPDNAMDNTALAVAQVFTTDVVVQGSICVGFDCVSSESFGFDTERLKENNLRIHFNDTSNSGSFPNRDWRIVINDTTNGGANYFAVEDSDAGTYPFRIIAGAGNNALYVDAQGDVGLNTSNPVVELHIADGDSPTMRLEQNGSSGFTPQTWDVAGNETNFFVRDVTNGSKLPFRIRPSAPDNSIYIDTDGDIGMGTNSPANNLHVRTTTESETTLLKLENANANVGKSVEIDVNYMNFPKGTEAGKPSSPTEGFLRGNTDSHTLEYYNGTSWLDLGSGGGGSSPWTTSGSNIYYNGGNVGIGTTIPGSFLTVKNGGGNLFTSEFLVEESSTSLGTSRAYTVAMSNINQTNNNFVAFAFNDAAGFSQSTATFGTIFTDHGNNYGKLFFSTRGSSNSIASPNLLIDENGNVGIGCANPSSALHVVGTISTTAVSVATSVACSSDARFKKNISPLQNSLEKVLNLQGVNYDWRIDEFPDKHFNEGQQLGFIAQEIEEVLPIVVQTDKEGYKSVDYSRLTPVLVEAVKEQQAIIDAQQAEINTLKSELASMQELKAQVAQLTQMVMKQNEAGTTKTQVGDE